MDEAIKNNDCSYYEKKNYKQIFLNYKLWEIKKVKF